MSMSLLRRSIVMLPLVLAACITEQEVPTSLTILGIPEGWSGNFDNLAGIGLTSKNTHSGNAAVYISGQGSNATNAVLLQALNSAPYLGKRVRLSAWLKAVDLTGENAGIWMRVDGENRILAFDNMSTRKLSGRSDWHQASVVLDVAPEAVGITFGALFSGIGAFEVDDMVFEVVGNEVATTDLLKSPGAPDNVSRSAYYTTARDVPVNMGFEGLPRITDATTDWIRTNSVALTTTDPSAPLTDLAAFGAMVGNAKLVGLGEGTHGTSEFHLQKHRFIRYLVEQKGFTQVAIEGSGADAELINRYVLTGQGDPAKALSAVRFWTANTQEMLDLIKWVRQWNTTAAPTAQVEFHGFDFQQPAGQMDSVEAYIARVDTANKAYVRSRFVCFDPHKSYGATYGAPIAGYAARLATSRAACAVGAKEVFALITNNAALYKSRASADEYERALHAARMVQQWEAFANKFTDAPASASNSRDSSMAENVQWFRARAGANAKMVLWAHNDHMLKSGGAMGGILSRALGADYVAVGFTFGTGALTAVYNGTIQAVRPTAPPSSWIEPILGAARASNFLLDMRLVSASNTSSAPLLGPVTMRSIGSTYLLTAASGFPRSYYFPRDFDLLVYIHTARETTVLPFVF